MTVSKNKNVQSVSREIGGRTLTIESGWMAKQASGSVVVTYGETSVFTSAVNGGPRDLPFFPLTVDYREKTYASGKIPGGFFKREGRPTSKEILTMRLTDRSVRPMFTEGFKNEVQIMSQVLSYDQENDSDVVSMIASFAALHISDIPFEGPMGAVRLGCIDGNIVLNPPHSILESDDNQLDLILAATPDAICMVEAGAKVVPEETLLDALQAGHDAATEIAEMCEELRGLCGKQKAEFTPPEVDEMVATVQGEFSEQFEKALLTEGKHERYTAIDEAVAAVVAAHASEGESEEALAEQARAKSAAKAALNRVERTMTLHGRRVDGRDTTTVRPIDIETRILARAHGSVLFTRGETQALVTATLGSTDDEQIIDGLRHEEPKRKFLLHYNFPPFCVGEARMIRGTSRREIGHGALAERAVAAVLPDYDGFPYTLRIVSDIMESNGSSSMATVCGASLSLMDAGVPIKAPVAGVAMGLIKEGDEYAILTDILGSEDHHGDMDFKVAGTAEGVTALQMDIKIQGITRELLSEALGQAREARIHILNCMNEVLDAPSSEVSPYAPVNRMTRIPSEKLGFLIGPKGSNIKKMQEDYGVNINVVNDDGDVQVSGCPLEKVVACIEAIEAMCKPVEIGTFVKGKVTGVKDFGCFVEIAPSVEGMCHISELDTDRVGEVSDICEMGDEIEVVVVSVDDRGKIRLSRRVALLPEEEREAAIASAQAPGRGGRGGGGRGGRDGGRRGGRPRREAGSAR